MALVVAVMSMMLMAALGSALILTTTTEVAASANYVGGVEAFYVADAAVERLVSDLPTVGDWSSLVGLRVETAAQALLPAASSIRVVVTVTAAAVEGAIVVRADAYGPRNVLRTVEATLARTDEVGPASVRLIAWRELR